MTVAHPGIAAAMQELAGKEYVELYELDTGPIYEVHGVATAAGNIYRWTPGIIDVTVEGVIPPTGTLTTTILTLDRLLPTQVGRAYRFIVALGAEEDSGFIAVSETTTVTINNPYGDGTISVTRVTLDTALPSVPAIGAQWTFVGTNAVKFGGNSYIPLPIEAAGFEWTGTGKLPKPKLRVSNVGNFAAALVIANGDLLGAKVTRLRTFREFLDDGENPDPSAFMDPDIFFVDRKSAHRKAMIEFELAPALEQQGLKLPRRIMLRDTCGFTYRQWITDANNVTGFVPGTCPYAGASYFKMDDTGTATASEDVCGQRLPSCVLRFGASANLPFDAFPGISIGGVR